ncbi:MAG: PilZ domain-containing protein [Bdellovibrionia bacterium]
MKQYKTRYLKAVAAVLIGFPILYLIASAILFDISAGSLGQILSSPYYYFVGILAMIAGYGIWEMRWWSWFLFLATQPFIAILTATIAYHYSQNHYKGLGFFISLVLQFFLTYRVSGEIFVPYLFPRIRWWESNPRYRLSVKAWIQRKNGTVLEGEILDLSLAGCFVKFKPALTKDEPVFIQFQLFGEEVFCRGNVVWITESAVIHPKGIGIKFNELARSQKRVLRSVVKRLRKISAFYRRYRYWMNQEEFLKRLEKLESPQAAFEER